MPVSPGHTEVTLCWSDTLQQVCDIKFHQISLKVDPIALYYTAMVIMIGTYWCDAIGYMATTSRGDVIEI